MVDFSTIQKFPYRIGNKQDKTNVSKRMSFHFEFSFHMYMVLNLGLAHLFLASLAVSNLGGIVFIANINPEISGLEKFSITKQYFPMLLEIIQQLLEIE